MTLTYDEQDAIVVDETGNMRCWVLMQGDWTPESACALHAFGRLMAAAPELVEALRSLAELFTYSDTMGCFVVPGNARTMPTLNAAREILKRAGVEP